MSSVHRYTIAQRAVLSVGEALVTWAERHAAARSARHHAAQHTRDTARTRTERHQRQALHAEKTREDAILRRLREPRQF